MPDEQSPPPPQAPILELRPSSGPTIEEAEKIRQLQELQANVRKSTIASLTLDELQVEMQKRTRLCVLSWLDEKGAYGMRVLATDPKSPECRYAAIRLSGRTTQILEAIQEQRESVTVVPDADTSKTPPAGS